MTRVPRTKGLTINGKDLAPLSAIMMKPRNARACFVFAHGAGAGMSHGFMEQIATGLYARGIATLRFQFPFMEKGSKRPDSRSSLLCMASGSSPTSSRNSVPPCACVNRPARVALAPVNDPSRWPKNSDSIISGGIAAQLTGTNGLSTRSDSAWIERAATSLPVPDWPVSSTDVGSGATRAKVSRTRRTAADSPINLSRSRM